MKEHLEGTKVVRAEEMARIEKESIDAGASALGYMLKAAEGIAQRIEAKWGKTKRVTLLAGKGNNGGDAFAAGAFLMRRGFQVEAYHVAKKGEESPLCKKQREAFVAAGGKLQEKLVLQGVIVDGLLGTGFKGKVEGELATVIKKANHREQPRIAIDIPSGVNGNTGEVASVAIKADETLFLGMPKVGFFQGEGYGYIGKLHGIDFGLERDDAEKAQAEGFLINEKALGPLLPPVKRTRHKYQSGYIVALAGSPGMGGAALLSCFSALKGGAGVVRLFYPKGMEEELAAAPYELVRTVYDFKSDREILEEGKRAKAFLIGPGLGREKEMGRFLTQVVSKLKGPVVLDADALYHLKSFPNGAVLTPHHKEMARLLEKESFTHADCQMFAKAKGVTVVLKGAPTWIFHPKSAPLIIPRGNPGMATAGTGDVLAGIIAAFLAQGVRGREGAALGVYLHALSGEIAAEKKTPYCMIASDLIAALPDAFRLL